MGSAIDSIYASGGFISASAAAASAPAAAAATPVVSAATLVHSPVVIEDPSAGFITEYLNANGSQVVSQSPSAIAVAYLHEGLTADGRVKTPSYSKTA